MERLHQVLRPRPWDLGDEIEMKNFTKQNEDLMYMVSKNSRAKQKFMFEAFRAEQARQNKIRKNECPTCGGKLIRGNRDKNNGYKRDWICNDCSIENNCLAKHNI